jgi:flagellar motor switch/type III secretory pathway protein FliN
MAAGAGVAFSSPSPEKTRRAEAGSHEAQGNEKSQPERSQFDEVRWRPVLGLLCQISVDLPLPEITVAGFLKLKPGSVVSTGWRLRRDVPLRVNGTLVAWGEFEGTGGRLAVRVTEVA